MRDIIDKKLRRGKIYLFAAIAFSVAIPLFAFFDDLSVFAPAAIIGITACFFVYFRYYRQFAKNMNWLNKRFMEIVADDISLERPTLPRSVIYCGQKAFYSDKYNLIIPYEDIIWIYGFIQILYFIPIRKFYVIRTLDGKKFKLRANSDEVTWLIGNRIIQHSPFLIVGHGKEQERRFEQYMKYGIMPEHQAEE